MKQVVDLEGSQKFRDLNLALVSIAIDPVTDLALAAREWRTSTPLLYDEASKVSRSYGVLRWAMPNGEPGHTFVLVGKDGKVKWIRDYGAPENGGYMYVPVHSLYEELIKHLSEPGPTSSATLERGAQLYSANCLVCHGGASGGSMMDIPPPHNKNGHTWHHPDCQIVNTVLNGSGEMGEMMRRMMGAREDTPRMPSFKGTLTEDDIKSILAYIKTWWTEEQRQWQANVTEKSC